MSTREAKLKLVFDEFDLEGDGKIPAPELARAQGALDSTNEDWLPAADADGGVSKALFLSHFERSLSRDASEFEAAVTQFMKVGCVSVLVSLTTVLTTVLNTVLSGGHGVSQGEAARTGCKA